MISEREAHSWSELIPLDMHMDGKSSIISGECRKKKFGVGSRIARNFCVIFGQL
jgi:hypothetical protein